MVDEMNLVKWDKIKHEIDTCTDVVTLSKLAVGLEAIQQWSKQSKQSKETQDEIGEYQIWLDVKRGHWVQENIPARPGNPQDQLAKNGQLIRDRLVDAGIGHHESPKLRFLSKMDSLYTDSLKEFIEQTKNSSQYLNRNIAVRFAKNFLRAAERLSEEPCECTIDDCDLHTCSCAELFAKGIKPDAVITDPPYFREFLPVFSELAQSCANANVPLVAVMSGHTYLPEVMNRLCEFLKYRWIISYMMPGPKARQWQAKVMTGWKPVLLFGEAEKWFHDVSVSDSSDKDIHEWGQSESGMASLIKQLTKPGQIICDPFLGGGTTAVVSLLLGRKFVGCDIDETCVNKTKKRIATALKKK